MTGMTLLIRTHKGAQLRLEDARVLGQLIEGKQTQSDDLVFIHADDIDTIAALDVVTL